MAPVETRTIATLTHQEGREPPRVFVSAPPWEEQPRVYRRLAAAQVEEPFRGRTVSVIDEASGGGEPAWSSSGVPALALVLARMEQDPPFAAAIIARAPRLRDGAGPIVLRHVHLPDQSGPPGAQDLLAGPVVGAGPLPLPAEYLGLMDLGADMVQLLHEEEDDLL
ncbi:hypothetical protein HPB47_007512 [Ixodes persulcatus]|uniref:Uncharacterized protein n=1 Tax=Ixodes persulcatus TaxID=34615 RepID=A0AC60P7M7_IXOPE|nr:hypothetical protein HPB47_007512 [Ixodes persulcatus]